MKKNKAIFLTLFTLSLFPVSIFSQGSVSIRGNNIISDSLKAGMPSFSGSYSNLLGYYAGHKSLTGNYNNYLGYRAGYNSNQGGNQNTCNNFIGYSSGEASIGSANNNFIGKSSGLEARNVSNSSYMGGGAGKQSRNNQNCIFLGTNSGFNSSDVTYGIFLGKGAGAGTSNTSYSVLIGFHAGMETASGEKIKGSNIIIGPNTTLPAQASRSLNIGNVLYGSGLQQGYDDFPVYTPTPNGKIGIGVVNPEYTLDVNGKFFLRTVDIIDNSCHSYLYWSAHRLVMGTPKGTYAHNILDLKPGGSNIEPLYSCLNMYTAVNENEHDLKIRLISSSNCFFNNSGNVGIGTSNPEYKLDVKGTIRAMEVKVESVDNFPDYVFGKDYTLRSLNEVKDFIRANGHLPEIPSAQEVKENGMSLVEMNKKLLQKVEELTLYAIEQQRQIDELRNKIEK